MDFALRPESLRLSLSANGVLATPSFLLKISDNRLGFDASIKLDNNLDKRATLPEHRIRDYSQIFAPQLP
jgi:hypothetical protein